MSSNFAVGILLVMHEKLEARRDRAACKHLKVISVFTWEFESCRYFKTMFSCSFVQDIEENVEDITIFTNDLIRTNPMKLNINIRSFQGDIIDKLTWHIRLFSSVGTTYYI